MSNENFKFGICKQVNHGDSIVVREKVRDGHPQSKTLGIALISCPRLSFRPNNLSMPITQDERFAWEAREFLRPKLIGQEISYTETKMPKGGTLGDVYIGRGRNDSDSVALMLVSEGYAEVRKVGADAAAKSKIYSKLVEAETAAKAAKKGRWDPNSLVVPRSLCWTLEDPAAFLETVKNKPLKAIVEYIRDGSSMQVCLFPQPTTDGVVPVFNQVMLLLAGIRTPSFKMVHNELVPERLAQEAKLYVETRLLHREVTVLLYAMNNQNFVASVLHPKGDIAEFLLADGLAHCADWTIDHVNGKDQYRAAEMKSKASRLGLWVNYEPPAPKVSLQHKPTAGNGNQHIGHICEVGNGDNVSVRCADGSVRKFFLSSIRPLKLNMHDPKAQPITKGMKPLYDIPLMFEAREYLRKFVGKKVNVQVDYVMPKREDVSGMDDRVCATVEVAGGPNLAEGLLSRGLAQIMRYRNPNDSRAKHYDKLVLAEEEAVKKLLGWHSKAEASPMKVNELTGPAAKNQLTFLQRSDKISGIVEFVGSGSRLRVFLPKLNSVITFLCGAIVCPRNHRLAPDGKIQEHGDFMGEEAMKFTKELLMQRNVEVEVESVNKVGHFIGYIHMPVAVNINGAGKAKDKQKSQTNVLNVAMVLQGLATIHGAFGVRKSPHYAALTKAQDEARQAKKGLWSSPEFTKKYDEQDNNNNNGVTEQANDGDQSLVDNSSQMEEGSSVGSKPDISALIKRIASAKPAHIMNVVVESPGSDGVRLAIQFSDDAKIMQELNHELNSHPPSPVECSTVKLQKGQMCAAKFSYDQRWYRAQIVNISGKIVTVLFLDFGNEECFDLSENKNKDSIGPLNPKWTSAQALTRMYRLTGVKLSPDEAARAPIVQFLSDEIQEAEVLVHVDSVQPIACGQDDKRPLPTVSVFYAFPKISSAPGGSSARTESKTGLDLAEQLLSHGLAYVEPIRLPRDVKNRLEEAQKEALRTRIGIWRYGDCRPDD